MAVALDKVTGRGARSRETCEDKYLPGLSQPTRHHCHSFKKGGCPGAEKNKRCTYMGKINKRILCIIILSAAFFGEACVFAVNFISLNRKQDAVWLSV